MAHPKNKPSKKKKNLVFWPLAGAWGAGGILSPCAQLLWCESCVVALCTDEEEEEEEKKTVEIPPEVR